MGNLKRGSMSSQKQIDANRLNAQHSTGPRRTAAGIYEQRLKRGLMRAGLQAILEHAYLLKTKASGLPGNSRFSSKNHPTPWILPQALQYVFILYRTPPTPVRGPKSPTNRDASV